jgi:hypothetical protein
MAFLQYDTVRLKYSDGSSLGAAGVYTKTITTLPAGSIIVDVIVHAVALWNQGTSATLIVGDSVDDDGFFTAVNLKATDLLAAESLSLAFQGGKQGADVDAVAAGMQVRRRRLTTERAIIAKVTAVGTAATTGEIEVTVIYAAPTEGNGEATFA